MGSAFGKYELIRKIATGGMAEIWLARQRGMQGFEKPVVIKRILSSLSQDEAFVKMFLDEARTVASLNHPNIVQIYDLGCIDGQYFIAMEYVDGVDVSTVLKHGRRKKLPLKLRFTLRIISQTCEGLHFAHFLKSMNGQPMNIVHRDVSPQNILISYNGSIKITDFGIAKARGRSTTTNSGTLKGKFGYMSPEQVSGKELDQRSDVFSLGIVLWEMLTYRRLFKKENEAATILAVAQEEIPPPRRYWPNLPAELDRITTKALDRDVGRRYQTARDLGNDLERYLSSQGLGVVPSEIAQFLDVLFPDKNIHDRDPNAISSVSAAAYRKEESDSKSLPMVTRPRGAAPAPSAPAFEEPRTKIEALKKSASPRDIAIDAERAGAAAEDDEVEGAPEEERTPIPEAGPAPAPTRRPDAEKAFDAPKKPAVPHDYRPSVAIKVMLVAVPLVLIGLFAGAYFAFFGSPPTAPKAPVAPVAPLPLDAVLKAVREAKKAEPAPPDEKPPQPAGWEPAVQKTAVKKDDKKTKETPVAVKTGDKRPKEQDSEPQKKPDPQPAKSKEPAEAAGDGYLNLDSEPWAEVWSGSTKLGDTPLVKIKVPSGTLQLLLKNPELGFEKKITVAVAANETVAKKIAVKKGVLNVTSDVPSEVYVAKTKVGDTPLSGYEIFEGSYKVRLVNREKGLEKVVSVTINPGQTRNVSETLAK